MRTFLGEVAERLYGEYGEDISSLSVMFSSQRARLFFADALRSIAERPIWEPSYLTIDDVMSELSGLRRADRIRLLTELYRVYSRHHHGETFDRFYHWGEMLLSDFDMVDKYLVDASQLFRNISDIKELEADVDYLTPEQLHIINFWRSVGDETPLSEQKRRFLEIWKTLGTVYAEFRGRLRSLGIAYSGMIAREAVERIARGEAPELPERHYVVAGFNALSECERRLFAYLKTNYRVDIFWDYDDYYVDDPSQEAGRFVRRNLTELPPVSGISHDNFKNVKELHAVAASSDVVQCKYAAQLLATLSEERGGATLDKETAVVLTDENLLMPLLYAVPQSIGAVNVTMGYPLRNTLAYSLLERLLELQAHARQRGGGATFYHVDVDGLLSHPYIADLCPERCQKLRGEIVRDRLISVPVSVLACGPELERIFRPVTDWSDLMAYLREVVALSAETLYSGDDVKYRTEYLGALGESIARLHNMMRECGMDFSAEVTRSLVRRHLQNERIPFEGEPLEGAQVMGILETRNLDFRNVIILSMTDDNFPGVRSSDSSFIPYALRYAYGLPTPEHHEAVYAYYFYRLVQRAESVYMVYSSHADEKSTGEPSRYIRQLEYESGRRLIKSDVGVEVNPPSEKPIEIFKDEAVMRSLGRFTDGTSQMSPTAFSRYVECPLKFYFASVAKIRTDDELTDEVDNMTFGNIFHKAAELLYDGAVGEVHPSALLRRKIESGEVERVVERAIREEYFNIGDDSVSTPEFGGELMIIRDIVTRYLRDNVAGYDMRNDRFAVVSTEHDVTMRFPFTAGGQQMELHFGGVSDRVDSLDDGTIRVVDYKTGAEHLEFNGIEALFHGKAKERMSNFINTLMYAMMLRHESGRDVIPTLYYVRKMNDEGYSPLLNDKSAGGVKGAPYSVYERQFEQEISAALSEMFDAEIPFRQCEDANSCTRCDFADICFRKAD